MSSKIKNIISSVYTDFMLYIFTPVAIIGLTYYVIRDHRISRIIEKEGEAAIATIIDKSGARFTYDVEYNGAYYVASVTVPRKIKRQTQIGDRFPALILKDKMHHHDNRGLGPSYMRIILSPYPEVFQDRQLERERIEKMYNKSLNNNH